jgi:hypothetical protein
MRSQQAAALSLSLFIAEVLDWQERGTLIVPA